MQGRSFVALEEDGGFLREVSGEVTHTVKARKAQRNRSRVR